MKKVYCKNCKYFRNCGYFGNCVKILKNAKYSEFNGEQVTSLIYNNIENNKNGLCSYYEEKPKPRWKFWVK